MDNHRRNCFNISHKIQQAEHQYPDIFYVRHRKRTTRPQLIILEKTFESCLFPDSVIRKKLGDKIGMSPRRVQVWFQNRRARLKREKILNLKPDNSQSFCLNENECFKKSFEELDFYSTDSNMMTKAPDQKYYNIVYNSKPFCVFYEDIEFVEDSLKRMDTMNRYTVLDMDTAWKEDYINKNKM